MVVDFRLVAKLLTPALFVFGLITFIPAIYAHINEARGGTAFYFTGGISIFISFILYLIGKKAGQYPSLRVLFLFTTSLWVIVSLISAIPFYYDLPDINIYKAIFESCSALSTTGSTVITNLDSRPNAILLWRAILQYVGGVGFVALAVIILPISAMGGMSIFRTESSSFDDSAKYTPHIKIMALSLIIWYIAILGLCTFLYVVGGFDLFRAITTAMSTVATGGMTPTDMSMNGTSPFIQYTAIIFMFISSCPFMLILSSLAGNYLQFFKDQQVRGFLMINLVIAISVAVSLVFKNDYSIEKAFRISLFNVVAITSTTGFGLEDFTLWNHFASMAFLFILAIGGCSGSTSGGIKTFRLQICYSMYKSQLLKLIHPHIVSEPRFKGKVIDPGTLSAVITYMVSYIALLAVSSVIASILGLDLGDSVTATISCLSNIGPAMGTTLNPSTNFSQISDALCLLFSCDMILGRLEILPVLLCFTRTFYKL
ncbi:MAG: TrkH family potassium uptake protein [Succinivibrio dextrinosolvens]|nr:TrkH family potassium uptake protein [Succinivibrio dextrinosolvens]